ncbi:MAG: hypothetical protein NWP98_05925 [Erythrobacter sp.]|nr:hypothetical protein [Erythrobacter sp.]
MSKPDLSLTRELEASLAWWRAAGVDCDFGDDATAWLADDVAQPSTPAAKSPGGKASLPKVQPSGAEAKGTAPDPFGRAAASPPMPASTPLRRNLLGDSPPGDLAAFRTWWLEAPDLDTARLYPRIAPRGPVGAGLMVLVPQPEEHDRDALLQGPQGRLLANILAAMGLDEAQTYIASALPSHTPMADLAAIGAGGMDAVLAHHIMLARPARLLVLGTGLAPLLHPVKDEFLRESNQTIVNTPVMVSETLDAMIDMPRLKARFWKRWIEWSASQ